MKYLKVFIAGLTFPCIVLPFWLLFISSEFNPSVYTHPAIYFVPLIWGVWNIVYFAFLSKVLPGNSTIKLLLTGAILGFLIALYEVFVEHIPSLLGMPYSVTYLPLIVAPIFYALCWLFIVNPLNHLLGVDTTLSSK